MRHAPPRLLVPLALAALLAGVAPAAADASAPATRAEAWHPMEAWLGVYPFVAFALEGVEGAALLDTGASLTIVDEDLAARAGLRARERVSVRGMGGRERGRRARDATIELCGRRIEGVDPVVLDLQALEARFGRPLDAVIGGDVFSTLRLDLDYPNARVALRPLDRAPALPEKGTRRVPLGAVGKTRRSATLTLGRHGAVRLLVDTGSGSDVSLYRGAARRLGVPAKDAPKSTRLGGGVGGDRRQWLTLVDDAVFAGDALGALEVHVPRRGSGGKATTQGLLGGGVLARYRVVFDLSQREMILVGGRAPRPPARDRLGLQALWRRGALRVLHVGRDSPAERAGWRRGETIARIRGEAPSPRTWRLLLHEASTGPPGTRVVLESGEGEPRESVLRDLSGWAEAEGLQ